MVSDKVRGMGRIRNFWQEILRFDGASSGRVALGLMFGMALGLPSYASETSSPVGNPDDIEECPIACQLEQANVMLILHTLFINERSRQLLVLYQNGDDESQRMIRSATQEFCNENEELKVCLVAYHQFWFVQLVKIREAILQNDSIKLELAKGQPTRWESAIKVRKPVLPKLPALAEMTLKDAPLDQIPGPDTPINFHRELVESKVAPSKAQHKLEETSVAVNREWTSIERDKKGNAVEDEDLSKRQNDLIATAPQKLLPPKPKRKFKRLEEFKNDKTEDVNVGAYEAARGQMIDAFLNPKKYDAPTNKAPPKEKYASSGKPDEKSGSSGGDPAGMQRMGSSASKQEKASSSSATIDGAPQVGQAASNSTNAMRAARGAVASSNKGNHRAPEVSADGKLTMKQLLEKKPELAKSEVTLGINPAFLNSIVIGFAERLKNIN